MPRFYKRKSNKGLTPRRVMEEAVQYVRDGASTRDAARKFGIPRTTLRNNIKKAAADEQASLEPNYLHSMIFTHEQETSFSEYLKTCSQMFHGLTQTSARTLAYEMATVNKIPCPDSWKKNGAAGQDWMKGFLKRHPSLSLRLPEATSLSRALSFNRHNVKIFFDNLQAQMKVLKVSGKQIYNLDETGLTTVQKSPKVIASKGTKQVGQITSRERGELVTLCGIVSATGQSIPPVYIFPRKKFSEFFMSGAPESSLGLTSSNGWMNSENFALVMKHFIKHARPSADFPVILIMDNHRSHLSTEALQLARKNCVHVITLPPHTSNKTQPLDRTVFGPLKAAYNQLANSWMMMNVGKGITIYNVAELGGKAWLKAATPANIVSGFKASGIWPYDRDIFSDYEYLPSTILSNEPTMAPSPDHALGLPEEETMCQLDPSATSTPKAIDDPVEQPCSSGTQAFVTPQVFKGVPKGASRSSEKKRKHKKQYSIIATASPEMQKRETDESRPRKRNQTDERNKPIKKRKVQPPLLCYDSNDESSSVGSNSENRAPLPLNLDGVIDPKPDDFVLCVFSGRKVVVYYVGIVRKLLGSADDVDMDDLDIEVEFLRKSEKHGGFIRPQVRDISNVPLSDIVSKLTRSENVIGTSRMKLDTFSFQEDLSTLLVR